jgi:peptidoglycan/xylan/chitin deacetylase (PgdA/CDA1 family)
LENSNVKKIVASLALAAAAALSLLANGCAVDDSSAVDEDLLGAHTLNGAGAPGLILTFDDGPKSYPAPVTYTSIIDGKKTTVGSSADFAEWLQTKGVKATFFMVGNVVEQPGGLAQLRRIAAAGHTIGSHTWGHITSPAFGALPIDKQKSEIARTDEILFREEGFSRNLLENAHGNEVVFLRTPGGAWDKNDAPALSAEFGTRYVGPINWDIGGDAPAADWSCWAKKYTVDKCADLYRGSIEAHHGKGIVLMHDIHAKSALMAMRLIEEHLQAGDRFYSLADAPKVKALMDATQGFSDHSVPVGGDDDGHD